MPPDEESTDSYDRLQKQAKAEESKFEELGFQDLLEKGLGGHGALVAQLNKAFISHLKTTWVPMTLEKLDAKRGEVEFENAKLGMPAAHETPLKESVKNAIARVILLRIHLSCVSSKISLVQS